ncbi:MAG: hypothetical protein ACREND_15690, partial [Gemmatimonadaceae bacterium]
MGDTPAATGQAALGPSELTRERIMDALRGVSYPGMSGAFRRGAGRDVAAQLGAPFLGEIPFDETIVQEGDDGTPTM